MRMNRIIVLVVFWIPALWVQVNSQPDPNFKVLKNEVYGMVSGAALLMDVYQPSKAISKGIVMIPGSGWHASNASYDERPLKESYKYMNDVRDSLLKYGFTVFIINHRNSPVHKYPTHLEDAQRAVRFIRSQSSKFAIDSLKIGGIGHSSGAHLVAMLGVYDDPEIDSIKSIDQSSFRLQSVVPIAAPFDLVDFDSPFAVSTVTSTLNQRLSFQDGNPIRYGHFETGSPLHWVSSEDSAFLIFCGKNDPIVPARQSWVMKEKLDEVNVKVEIVEDPDGGHAPILDHGKIVNWFLETLE